MSAVLVQSLSRDDIEGRGHELLIEWGKHRRGGDRTRSAVASSGWHEPLDKCYEDEPDSVLLIDDVLLEIVADAARMVKVFYLEHPRYSVWEVAEKLHRTPKFTLMTLRGVCALVEMRIPE